MLFEMRASGFADRLIDEKALAISQKALLGAVKAMSTRL
jgi:hypothetical protein